MKEFLISQLEYDMVAAIEFYGDESGDAKDPHIKVVSMAGFMATVNDWENFDDLWRRGVLDEHRIPYLHMREFYQYRGPFERFKNDSAATINLLQDIATVIRISGLRGSGAAIILEELNNYNSANSINIDPYGLCLYVTFGNLNAWYPNALRNLLFQMFLDRSANGHKRAAAFKELLATDRLFQRHLKAGLAKAPIVTPLPHSSPGSKNIPALQAADFSAWELAKSVNLKLRWFTEVKPNLPSQDQQTIDKSLIEFQAKEPKITSGLLGNGAHSPTFSCMAWLDTAL